jgi:hypothetical protein
LNKINKSAKEEEEEQKEKSRTTAFIIITTIKNTQYISHNCVMQKKKEKMHKTQNRADSTDKV